MAPEHSGVHSKKAILREMLLLHLGKEVEGAKILRRQNPIPLEERGYRDYILIVDDEQSYLELSTAILKKHGFGCVTAPSVAAAREILFARSDISLILSDLKMPDEDGYALLEFVRGNLRFRHIPVIIASSLALGAYVQKAIQMGAKDYLAKPISEEALISRIRKVLEPGKGTVLIVTDSEITAQILREMLKRGGYHVLEAKNGAEAEEVLKQHRASAVISELVLHDMTGLDLLTSVAERFLDVPVLFLADPHIAVREEEIVAAGAHGLIRRPISGPELLHRITSLHFRVKGDGHHPE